MNKPSKTSADILSLSYVGLSLIGLIVLAVSTFTSPAPTANPNLQKGLISSIFVTISLAGIIGAAFPSSCSPVLRFKNREKLDEREKSGQEATIRFVGHHPTCGSFSAHVFTLGDRTYCVGCTGLTVGAIVSLVTVLLHFFFGFNVGERGVLVFWFGFVAVTCGLLQHQTPNEGRWGIRFFLNVAFASGASLLLVGVDEITGSFVLEAYLLALMIYWIMTRIMISQLEHRKICETCLRPCDRER